MASWQTATHYLSWILPPLLVAPQGVWAPYYVIHKIMAGLLDANVLTGNTKALEMVRRYCAEGGGQSVGDKLGMPEALWCM